MDNCLVVAGPGAGKTELLAQRANYLLETGGCPDPRHILAISFKKDAADNLAARIEEISRNIDDIVHLLTHVEHDGHQQGHAPEPPVPPELAAANGESRTPFLSTLKARVQRILARDSA